MTMAITAATLTSDLSGFITPEQSAPIFQRAARESVLMRLAKQVPLGPSGVTVPVVTGRPTATWVGEGGQKTATKGALTPKSITPKKLAAILVESKEVVRLNPGNYINLMRDNLAEAFALAFDYAGFHDLGGDGTGSGPFSTYIDQTTNSVELGTASVDNGGTYKDLIDGMAKVVSHVGPDGRRARVTGWAFDDVVEPALLLSVDKNGRPIYIDTPFEDTTTVRGGRLVGRPSYMGEAVATPDQRAVVGYAGDFSQCAWGVVGGISYDISTQATVTINGALTSLWENNLVAILAEAEYGWLVNDTGAFTKFTNTNNSPVTSS
jgi:HK97 family phage major capsid protein